MSTLTGTAMGIALAVGYGGAGLMAGRYLYPAKPAARRWLFVCTLDRLAAGESFSYTTPTGEKVAIARQTAAEDADAFVALSSTCPHLGCQVHWQPAQTRFFCPCHNGVFDPSGQALEGPPADAGQDLPRYPLRVVGGLLYIEVPTERLG